MLERLGGIAVVALLGACGFSVNPATGDAGAGERVVAILDDEAAEFAAYDQLTGGVIAARGALEPHAFVLGGLHARAFPGNLVADASTFDSVAQATAQLTSLGAGYRHVPADWSGLPANRPRGLGITTTDNYTVIYTGEILLPAGELALHATADDRAVVQVALDGATFGERLFVKNATAAITLQSPAAGWYPIRAAYSQAGGDAGFALAITPQFGTQVAIEGTRLRVRVTDTPGLIAQAFIGQLLAIPVGEIAVPTVDVQYGVMAPPHDLEQPANQFSHRYAGQLRIDAAGIYSFRAEIGTSVEDRVRIWVDGVPIASSWAPAPDVLVGEVELAPGWHDLLVDHSENEDGAQLRVLLAGPGIPEGPIEPARLRPAIAFGLTASAFGAAAYPLTDATMEGPSTTEFPLPLAAPPGATLDAIDLGFGIAAQRMSDLVVSRVDCAGATPLVLAATPASYYAPLDTSCAGSPVAPPPTWSLRVRDSVIGNDVLYVGQTPSLYFPLLVATYHGGDRMPFAPAVTYVSTPRPTPGALRFGKVTLTTDLRGGSVALEMRAGATEEELAAAAWVEVGGGTAPLLVASELVQYRLTLLTDGWQHASVDKVELTYVVPAE